MRVETDMSDSKPDLRVMRTRKAIKQSFEEMVSEAGLGKITVKALAERAGINRKTFYLHYETLEALYDNVMNEIMDDFFENYETTPEVPEDIDGHARRFFLFLAGQPKIVEELVCQPSYYDFGERVYREQMTRYKASGDPFVWLGDGKYELTLSFIRNTALDFYRQWVRDGKVVPPEEAAKLLSELTCHGVEQLMR